MKKLLIVLLLSFQCVAQEAEDYKLLNDILSVWAQFNEGKAFNIYSEPLNFYNQKVFFSSDFIADFTDGRVVGVNSDKLNEALNHSDLNKMGETKRDLENWDFSKLNYKVNSYSESENKMLNGQKQIKFGKPIYTLDNNFAFVYIFQICGEMDCSYKSIQIFKKSEGRWKYHTEVPVRSDF